MKEVKQSLNEQMFTFLCKQGSIRYKSELSGTMDITFYKSDIMDLCSNKKVIKYVDDSVLEFSIGDINLHDLKSIVERSPIYSELSQELERVIYTNIELELDKQREILKSQKDEECLLNSKLKTSENNNLN